MFVKKSSGGSSFSGGTISSLLTAGASVYVPNTATNIAEFDGTSASYVMKAAGVAIGNVSFPGLWMIGGGNTLGNSNYTLMNAGPTLLNAPSGQSVVLRVNNATCLTVDGTTVTFAQKAVFPATDSSGTPGAATINKPSGQVAIAAAASSVVVTNSLVSTTSVVYAVIQGSDATLTQILRVVPASGSFTITGNANATAAVKVGFVVFN